ncbi:hypothetical protein OIU84_029876 [Salix udensis]|uniref:Uncharacterized protein n=1 Tax=Salix udensis TaxID=889485 RepID=A0AAD6KAT9_9ROSI|nr:hypothetical protein OIU84_029876 [Salix udensis]
MENFDHEPALSSCPACTICFLIDTTQSKSGDLVSSSS